MSFETEVLAPKVIEEKWLEPFIQYGPAMLQEGEYRDSIVFDKLCRFGINPLDDCMRAIAPRELIVISAGSGFGKSELALHISRYNALRGKRVVHFNLEGGWHEAISRMTWRDICHQYYTKFTEMAVEMDYRKWVLNENPNPFLIKLASAVYTAYEQRLKDKLFFFDHPHGLTLERFKECLKFFNSSEHIFDTKRMTIIPKDFEADLIVLDHIHYFRYADEKEDIRAMTEIMQTCKDLTEQYEIPIIVVAHLRKLPRGHGIPDKEDIYGTSNIHKIANTCLILSPDYEKKDLSNDITPTFIRVAKSRQGIPPNILLCANFHGRERRYNEKYELYRCNGMGAVDSTPIEFNELPPWAKAQYNNDRKLI